MSAVDTRNISRDSLFLMADIRIDGGAEDRRVKVRNLSAGGMMAEGELAISRGTRVSVNLRNIGWVDGSVAWVQDNRCGIAFFDQIDPKLPRSVKAELDEVATPRFARAPRAPDDPRSTDPSRLRKI